MIFKREITFAIVSHNSDKTLRGAIESCLTTIRERYPNTGKVVVYDNASVDSCPAILDEFACRYPDHFIGVKDRENLGFACANNRAIAISPSHTYVLVNPDVTFKPDAIVKLLSVFKSDQKVAVVCPKLLYLDQTQQKSFRRFPTFKYFLIRQLFGYKFQNWLYPFDYYYEDMSPPAETVEIHWGIGAFMAISGEYVERYGLFDERFFLYFEDVSLCVDAWQNGYRVLFHPQACALHLYQQASTRSRFNYLTFIHIISALKFFAKYRPYQKRWKIIVWLLRLQQQPSRNRQQTNREISVLPQSATAVRR